MRDSAVLAATEPCTAKGSCLYGPRCALSLFGARGAMDGVTV